MAMPTGETALPPSTSLGPALCRSRRIGRNHAASGRAWLAMLLSEPSLDAAVADWAQVVRWCSACGQCLHTKGVAPCTRSLVCVERWPNEASLGGTGSCGRPQTNGCPPAEAVTSYRGEGVRVVTGRVVLPQGSISQDLYRHGAGARGLLRPACSQAISPSRCVFAQVTVDSHREYAQSWIDHGQDRARLWTLGWPSGCGKGSPRFSGSCSPGPCPPQLTGQMGAEQRGVADLRRAGINMALLAQVIKMRPAMVSDAELGTSAGPRVVTWADLRAGLAPPAVWKRRSSPPNARAAPSTMRLHAALALAAFLAPAAAVFEDDAFHIDFHYALLGYPKQETTFFHKPYAASKASLLYTVSENGTVGAVNPKDGALVWRSAPGASAKGLLRAGEEQDTVISAVEDRITAWSASDGRIVWETRVDGATAEDLEILEQEDGISNNDAKDAIVLLGHGSPGVKRLDGKTGRVKWAFEDTSGDTPFQVSSSPTTIYYVALHAPLLGGGSKLRVTSLSPITGKKLDSYTLNSEGEVHTKDNILFAGANTAAPLLAWTDKANKVLKVNIIGTKAVSSFNTPSSEPVTSIVLHAPKKANSLPHILVEYQTATGHSAEVYHVDLKKKVVSKAYSLPQLQGRGTFATSTLDANVYFTRITSEEVTVVASVSHGILGRWPVQGSPALAGAYPVYGVSEVVVKGNSASAVRSAVLFCNGQWVLIRNSEIAWARPEFLSGTVSAVWAQLPEEESLAHQLEEEGHQDPISAYIHRVQRHMRDLEHLPAWLQSLPNRILGSVAGKSDDTMIQDIQHDTFGFHKLVISATQKGRLSALDVGSKGKIVWSIDLHQLAPDTTFSSPSLKAFRGFVEVKDPGFVGSLFINSTTGGPLSSQNVQTWASSNLDAEVIITYELSEGELKGFLGVDPRAQPVWTFVPPSGEKVVSYTARPAKDPVASIGKVLGDRRVLYKYLNPNLVLVTAVSQSGRRASVYLLDSASGQLLHTASHYGVDISRPIPSTLSENWFSYSLTLDSSSSATSRGYQLVVSELYESPLPDDRGPLGASANSSTVQPKGEATKPYVLSQSFQIPEEISHMTVTQTRQGITSRELLVTLPSSNSIVGIPRGVIDPRRPVGRDPTAQEQSEGLVRYAPMIIFDPKWHLNHRYEVMGIKDVITSESGLESTSLVFAYGLDIFGTRVAPSFAFDVLGKGFNKIQMLLTVAALFVGVLFVAPLVRRKQINSLWTVPQ